MEISLQVAARLVAVRTVAERHLEQASAAPVAGPTMEIAAEPAVGPTAGPVVVPTVAQNTASIEILQQIDAAVKRMKNREPTAEPNEILQQIDASIKRMKNRVQDIGERLPFTSVDNELTEDILNKLYEKNKMKYSGKKN